MTGRDQLSSADRELAVQDNEYEPISVMFMIAEVCVLILQQPGGGCARFN